MTASKKSTRKQSLAETEPIDQPTSRDASGKKKFIII